jgi:hypothetical protein
LEAWHLLLSNLADLTLANNILDGVLSAWASGGESPRDIFLNFEVLLIYKITIG